MIRRAWVLGLLVTAAGCSSGADPSGQGGASGTTGNTTTTTTGAGAGGSAPCEPSQLGCLAFEHTFSTMVVTPGQEISGLCQSWTLDNPEEIFVSSVTLDNDGAYHHSNWFFVPNDFYDQPDGTWNCDDAKFDELGAAVKGGVLFAQSTQSQTETQAFANGAVIRIPPYSTVVGSTHLLNVKDQDVSSTLRMAIKTVPKAEAKIRLTPFRLTYHDLHIPPQASSEFKGSCDFKKALSGKPFSFKLHYVLPHYHMRGNLFRLTTLGGPDDGKEIAGLQGFDSEAHGQVLNPPLPMDAAQGFTFTCGYMNPTDQEIGWGIGDQEMCEMLGFAESEMAFEAGVPDGANMKLGVMNGTDLNTGPCNVLAVPWADKPGGKPPTK